MGYKNKTNKEYQTEWRAKNPERSREISRRWLKIHPEEARKKLQKSRQKVKFEILKKYGGDPPKCACCGEKIIEFLTIDHINGDGNKHRKMEPAAKDICYWLRSHKYPNGYRVLCMNCNFAMRFNKECPHQKK